jgi:solute carrier family 39 (zinc transporter), member 1/2/3
MAFGLMETIEQAGQLAAGILIHMSAEAISLGGAFARSGYKTKEIIVLLLVFSVITPIGTIIGMQIAESDKLIDTIFLSISGGTFIYVACSEIIVHEFDRGNRQWLKTILVLLGGAVISCLWFIEHSHAEEGEDHGDHVH